MRLNCTRDHTSVAFRKVRIVYPLVQRVLFFVCTLALVTGCATSRHMHLEDGADLRSKSNSPHELTPDFLYKYLAGELSGQRGDLGTSAAIFYELAKSEKDARLAERAAKIASFANIPGIAIPSIKLWVALDPTSDEAQQAATEVLIRTGNLNEIEPHLRHLLSKEEARAHGFLQLNGLFAKTQNKAAVLKLIQSLAKPYPDLAEAQFAVADAAWVAGNDKLALDALDQVEVLLPSWQPSVLLKGKILTHQSPAFALEFYRDYLKAHPDAVEVRTHLARLLVEQKQYEAAKLEFPIILDTMQHGEFRNLAEMTTVIGLLSYQAADYAAAETYYLQALNLGFKHVDQIYIYLGQTNEKLDKPQDALSWYQKVAAGPHYLEASFNYANIIARTQGVDKAIEWLDELGNLTTEQQISTIQAQANLLTKANRDEDAFMLLGKTVQNMPNTAELVYDYALAAERMQEFGILEAELRRLIAEKPDFAAAYNALGYSFADRNIRLDEAIKLIEKALSLSPNDHYMLDSLGWAYYRKGKLNKALDYLQQAYHINPDPEIAAHLGEVLWTQGQHDAAKKIWDSALNDHPDNDVLNATARKFKP